MVANSMASFHNLLILVVEIVGHKIDYKGLRLAIIAILDMVLLLLLLLLLFYKDFFLEEYEKDLVLLTGKKKLKIKIIILASHY